MIYSFGKTNHNKVLITEHQKLAHVTIFLTPSPIGSIYAWILILTNRQVVLMAVSFFYPCRAQQSPVKTCQLHGKWECQWQKFNSIFFILLAWQNRKFQVAYLYILTNALLTMPELRRSRSHIPSCTHGQQPPKQKYLKLSFHTHDVVIQFFRQNMIELIA